MLAAPLLQQHSSSSVHHHHINSVSSPPSSPRQARRTHRHTQPTWPLVSLLTAVPSVRPICPSPASTSPPPPNTTVFLPVSHIKDTQSFWDTVCHVELEKEKENHLHLASYAAWTAFSLLHPALQCCSDEEEVSSYSHTINKNID